MEIVLYSEVIVCIKRERRGAVERGAERERRGAGEGDRGETMWKKVAAAAAAGAAGGGVAGNMTAAYIGMRKAAKWAAEWSEEHAEAGEHLMKWMEEHVAKMVTWTQDMVLKTVAGVTGDIKQCVGDIKQFVGDCCTWGLVFMGVAAITSLLYYGYRYFYRYFVLLLLLLVCVVCYICSVPSFRALLNLLLSGNG